MGNYSKRQVRPKTNSHVGLFRVFRHLNKVHLFIWYAKLINKIILVLKDKGEAHIG